MWRGALIGLGNVAVNGHLPGWEGCDRAEIVAVADTMESRLAQQRWRLPRARLYTGVEALLTSEAPNFLDICTPPGTHAAMAHLALSRGVHVLCEKPLVLSPEELRLVCRAQTESGRILHTVHNWRYAPIILKVTDLVREGRIGTVRRLVWQTLRQGPVASVQAEHDNWRLDPEMAGGGILPDHGWHAFYVILHWLGQGPRTIAATLENRQHPGWDVEDTASLQLTFPDAVADIFLTWASPRRDNRALLEGTHGTIRLEDETLILTGRRGERIWKFEQALSQGSYHPEWFRHVREDFLREISDGSLKGENLATASLCVELLHLAKESHRRGGLPLALRGSAELESSGRRHGVLPKVSRMTGP
ncbi:MAG: Gfo/Idh/MocA family oxidoreductase [candidate division NC10 bacterium]|nr:Gfo/Idh/MocA family oxidoreductase [candidate division NC10 bacterium]